MARHLPSPRSSTKSKETSLREEQKGRSASGTYVAGKRYKPGSWAQVPPPRSPSAPMVRRWDVQTGKLLRAIEGKRGNTSSLSFSPRGQMLLMADGAEVALLETSTGLRRTTLMTVTERPAGK